MQISNGYDTDDNPRIAERSFERRSPWGPDEERPASPDAGDAEDPTTVVGGER